MKMTKRFIMMALFVSLGVAFGASDQNAKITKPLVASENPNYFKDGSGSMIILNGSQTWNTLQDWGTNGSPQPLDFDAFVQFLKAHGHNFTLLWRVEEPKFCGLPSTESNPPDFWVSPNPWLRTGPGKASDGGLKFDLTKFDQSYFDRLRRRTEQLRDAGIYAGVYLFTGEFLKSFRCPTDGYPFTGSNNVNGIDDGYKGGKRGTGSIAMKAPNRITALQDAYVDKVIDTLNDLPNVLWVVSEESSTDSVWWNNHEISHIRAYEAKKRWQHPIGYGTISGLPDQAMYDSDADFVKPQGRISPTTSCGSGKPRCKVNINDSDHSYWEMWNQTPQQNRNYAWENFMNGNQVLFMDPYTLYYPRQKRNLCESPKNGVCRAPDKRYENFRDNLGYIVTWSRRLNLAKVKPQGSLSSTRLCLAHTGAEYLVYAPSGGSFTVDLSGVQASRKLSARWFNPSTGKETEGGPVTAGSKAASFTAPFNGDAVLYIVNSAGHAVSTTH